MGPDHLTGLAPRPGHSLLMRGRVRGKKWGGGGEEGEIEREAGRERRLEGGEEVGREETKRKGREEE